MIVKIKFDYNIDGKEGTSYRVVVDGQEYKVDEKAFNLFDGVVLTERRFYDKDKGTTRISYTV